MSQDLDIVFKALGDPTRRGILDLLRASPGLSMNEISENFEITRFGIRKHMLLLEEANLVAVKWERPTKRFYLNAIPIRMIHDRWLSEYSSLWAGHLTELKYSLEEEEMEPKPDQVFVIYIRTKVDKLWKALTSPEETQKYYLGFVVNSGFQAGDDIRYHAGDELKVEGKIVEVEVGKKLTHTFTAYTELGESEDTLVAYEIEDLGDNVKLTVTHSQHQTDTLLQMTHQGWSLILSNLKSLLETGDALKLNP